MWCLGCGKEIDIICSRTWFPGLSGCGNMCGVCIGSVQQLKLRRKMRKKDETKEKDLIAFEEKHLYNADVKPAVWSAMLCYCTFIIYCDGLDDERYPGVSMIEIYGMALQYCKTTKKYSPDFLKSFSSDFIVALVSFSRKTYCGVDPQYFFSGEEREKDNEWESYCSAREFPFALNRGFLVFRPTSSKPVATSDFCIFGKDCL